MAIATSSENGGYDYKFIDATPDRYVCNICHLPSRDPYLTTCCGHVFCKSCLDDCKKAVAESNVCPVCREEDFVAYINKQLDREIKSLQVMCKNKERGCEWEGELNNIKNHLGNSEGCQFEDVKCSNECGKVLQRQYLSSHVETECPHRKVDCQYCHITGEHQFIEGEHEEQCPKLPILCPNKCEIVSVPRKDMEAHREECPLEMVQCEYHNVGCEERMMRKRKREHEEEEIEEHLLLTKRSYHQEVSSTRAELADTKSQLANALEKINMLNLLLGHSSHITGAVSDISVSKWWTELTKKSLLIKSGSQVCPVVVKVAGYSDKENNEVKWYSDSFYSSYRGYKMCLCLYPAGHGDSKGTHMASYLYLMKGPHDDKLVWPLRETFEVKVLNQIRDCEHYTVTVTFDDCTLHRCAERITDRIRSATGWGKPQLISIEDLHNITPTCQYLKDDCIFLQVSQL